MLNTFFVHLSLRSCQVIFGRVMALAPSADIQGSFNIGPNGEIVYKFSPLKPVSQFKPNMANAEHLKGSAFNAEVLLGVVNHGLMISFITLTCTDIQQFNKQYFH
jgi:hypothetical protein